MYPPVNRDNLDKGEEPGQILTTAVTGGLSQRYITEKVGRARL